MLTHSISTGQRTESSVAETWSTSISPLDRPMQTTGMRLVTWYVLPMRRMTRFVARASDERRIGQGRIAIACESDKRIGIGDYDVNPAVGVRVRAGRQFLVRAEVGEWKV